MVMVWIHGVDLFEYLDGEDEDTSGGLLVEVMSEHFLCRYSLSLNIITILLFEGFT